MISKDQPLNFFEHLYQRSIINRPALSFFVLLVILAIVAIGISNFRLDASSDSLTLESDRDLDFLREVNSRYSNGDVLVVTYAPHAELLSDASLNTLTSLRDELSGLNGVESVLSIIDVPMLYSPKISFTKLSGELPLLRDARVDKNLALIEFKTNPIYKNTLVSQDSKTTALLLNLEVNHEMILLVRERDALLIAKRENTIDQQGKERLAAVSKIYTDARMRDNAIESQRVDDVRAIVAKYQDRAKLYVGGASMITSDMLTFIQNDLIVFGIGILIFIIVTLFIIFRNVKLVVLPLLTCLLSVIFMLGLLGWLNWSLTVISSSFVSLLLIISLAISIHLLVRYQEHSHYAEGRNQQQLVFDTIRQMAKPCLYTALTTVVAFASLVVSGIRPVIDFGWMMTMGVIAAFVLTFLVIPLGLLLTGGIGKTELAEENPRMMRWFAGLVSNFPNAVVLFSALFAAVAIYGLMQLKVENRFIDYFKSDTEIHQGMLLIDNHLGGSMTLDVIIDAPEGWDDYLTKSEDESNFGEDDFDDGFGDESFEDDADGHGQSYWWNRSGLKTIERYHDFLEAQPEIGKVLSIATGYKLARDLIGSDLNDIELAFMQKSMSDEMQKALMYPYLNNDIQQVRISTRVKESSKGLSRPELIQRVENFALQELNLKQEDVRVTGLIVLYNNMLQSLFGSQIQTIVAVFIGILLMFLVLFRSFNISAIALVPNILAAGMVLGLMGLTGIPLDIMSITIAAITVGMGVDHAIHYIYRFRDELAEDGDYQAAMKRSHETIGRALVYTAITIIIGFSVLALSNFIPSIYFGLLTSSAMLAATFGSLTLLPRLIIIFKPFETNT